MLEIAVYSVRILSSQASSRTRSPRVGQTQLQNQNTHPSRDARLESDTHCWLDTHRLNGSNSSTWASWGRRSSTRPTGTLRRCLLSPHSNDVAVISSTGRVVSMTWPWFLRSFHKCQSALILLLTRSWPSGPVMSMDTCICGTRASALVGPCSGTRSRHEITLAQPPSRQGFESRYHAASQMDPKNLIRKCWPSHRPRKTNDV